MKIENIILDLGGVLYDLDYGATQKEFTELGMDHVFSKAKQTPLFDDLEEGKITREEFFTQFNLAAEKNHDHTIIHQAWNKMLLGMLPDKLELLDKLKSQYRMFLYSNTNELHIEEVWQSLHNDLGIYNLDDYFETVFLSNEMGIRKPKKEGFEYIIEQHQLDPKTTLFIDDSIQHVEGAKKAGIQAYWLDLSKENIHELLKKLNII